MNATVTTAPAKRTLGNTMSSLLITTSDPWKDKEKEQTQKLSKNSIAEFHNKNESKNDHSKNEVATKGLLIKSTEINGQIIRNSEPEKLHSHSSGTTTVINNTSSTMKINSLPSSQEHSNSSSSNAVSKPIIHVSKPVTDDNSNKKRNMSVLSIASTSVDNNSALTKFSNIQKHVQEPSSKEKAKAPQSIPNQLTTKEKIDKIQGKQTPDSINSKPTLTIEAANEKILELEKGTSQKKSSSIIEKASSMLNHKMVSVFKTNEL